MKIYTFLTQYMRSFTYVLEECNHTILIDPCEMAEVKMMLVGKTLDYAFLTHEHYDHISGTDWARSLGAKVIASEECGKNLKNVKLNHSKYYSAFCAVQSRLIGDTIPDVKEFITYADRTFRDDMLLLWQGHELLFKETPGHSSGSACLLIDKKTLFSGDTIFKDVEPNLDIMCGNREQLDLSIKWVLSLPSDVQVYPGHYGRFTIADKKAEG